MTWENFSAVVGFIGMTAALFFGITNFMLSREKKAAKEGGQEVMLQQILHSVDEVKTDVKAQGSLLGEVIGKQAVFDRDLKAIWHNIDDLKEAVQR